MKQVGLGRCPKPRQGPSPWTSTLMRVFDEVLSGAQLPLEHGVPFILRGTSDACFDYRTPRHCAAPAHARRHGDARPAITYAARLYSFRAQLRGLPRTV